MQRCPLCRATLGDDDTCRRCKADLGTVRQVMRESRALTGAAMHSLALGNMAEPSGCCGARWIFTRRQRHGPCGSWWKNKGDLYNTGASVSVVQGGMSRAILLALEILSRLRDYPMQRHSASSRA